ncbi:MAG: SCO family protein, partial [Pseudomonadota bacterium]
VQQRGEKQIELVSVTTDSPYDTSQRLRQWAGNFNAGPGWTQITGEKQQVDRLLKSLDAFSADKTEHSTLILLINDHTQQRKWIDGNSDPETILTALNTW